MASASMRAQGAAQNRCLRARRACCPCTHTPCTLRCPLCRASDLAFQCSGIEVQEWTDGQLLCPAPPASICTDSRTLQQGQWFLALEGATQDGHDHIVAAVAAGAGGIIASSAFLASVMTGASKSRALDNVGPGKCGLVVVDDTQQALQDLAAAARRAFTGPVVAITGSVGKSTCTSMATAALRASGHVVVHAIENRNGQIGLPLTILQAPAGATALVLELGMSEPGEIAILSAIAAPTVRVLLNASESHQGGCGGSVAGVRAAKLELLQGSAPTDAWVLGSDDAVLWDCAAAIARDCEAVYLERPDGNAAGNAAGAQPPGQGDAAEQGREVWSFGEGTARDSSSWARGGGHVRVGASSTTADLCAAIVHTAFTLSGGCCTGDASADDVSTDSRISAAVAGEGVDNDVHTVQIPQLGGHLGIAAAAATAIAAAVGRHREGEESAQQSRSTNATRLERVLHSAWWSQWAPMPGRMQACWPSAGVLVLHDAYNASPRSMACAFQLLESLKSQGESGIVAKLGVLGDMGELGEASAALHGQVLQQAAAVPGLQLALLGPSMCDAAAHLGEGRAELVAMERDYGDGDVTEFAEAICGWVAQRQACDECVVVLVKASRFMQLERLVAALSPGCN